MAQCEDLEFKSQGITCRGYFHHPDNRSTEKPCVVMAHGFAATRDSGLAPFAEAFVAAGYAAFVFDYRHFGASDGEPRQVLDPRREIEDWLAAIEFVRGQKGVRADAIVLWGTSFAGGLVTVAAARDGNVQGIIAQCPMMDGMASVRAVLGYAGLAQLMRLSGHALLDIGRATLHQAPHYIASAGRPGEIAAMASEDSYEGYLALLPQGAPNKVAARIGATLGLFRPVNVASRVKCPALVLICEKDTVAPVSAAEKAAAKMPQAEVVRFPIGHFDIYQGEARATAIRDQLDFLSRHVPI